MLFHFMSHSRHTFFVLFHNLQWELQPKIGVSFGPVCSQPVHTPNNSLGAEWKPSRVTSGLSVRLPFYTILHWHVAKTKGCRFWTFLFFLFFFFAVHICPDCTAFNFNLVVYHCMSIVFVSLPKDNELKLGECGTKALGHFNHLIFFCETQSLHSIVNILCYCYKIY